MTATEMLTWALNATLRRKVVDGAKLRRRLIQRGIIKPNGWHLGKETRTRTAVNGQQFTVTAKVLKEAA